MIAMEMGVILPTLSYEVRKLGQKQRNSEFDSRLLKSINFFDLLKYSFQNQSLMMN